MTPFIRRTVPVALAFASLFFARLAAADSFVPLPEVGGDKKDLEIRFVEYAGSTNGAMVVDIRNRGKKAQTFEASGLYFVPKGDPEQAPQRLGAAGPFSIEGQSDHVTELPLAPGETRRVKLEVFCIDSHRSSPSARTRFKIAKKRMPKKLRHEIKEGAAKIIRDNKGDFARSKSAIQSHTWESRDKKWIRLEGERRREKAAPVKSQERRQRHR